MTGCPECGCYPIEAWGCANCGNPDCPCSEDEDDEECE